VKNGDFSQPEFLLLTNGACLPAFARSQTDAGRSLDMKYKHSIETFEAKDGYVGNTFKRYKWQTA
jgi:hypothetical protein